MKSVLALVFGIGLSFSGVAMAQATAAPPAATQSITVDEPNIQALTPSPPGSPPSNPSMPRWSEFPVAPKDVPPVSEFATRVQAQEQNRAQLLAGLRAIQWETYEPAAIKAEAAAAIDPSKLAPVDGEMTPAESEALAQSLRREATPPPVAQ